MMGQKMNPESEIKKKKQQNIQTETKQMLVGQVKIMSGLCVLQRDIIKKHTHRWIKNE